MPEELLDIYDKNQKPLNMAKTRSEIHAKGYWHAGVYVWILNSKNQLLIQKRSEKKENHPNTWDVSVAGHISAGSTALATAVREVKEEIGLDISASELQNLFSITESQVLKNGKYIDNEFHQIFLLRKDLELKDLKLQQEEVVAVDWMPVEKLKELAAKDDPAFVPHQEQYKKLAEFLLK